MSTLIEREPTAQPQASTSPTRRQERPDTDWVRATCPSCGSEIVSNAYYVGGRGYVIIWECWESLGEAPTCDYRRRL